MYHVYGKSFGVCVRPGPTEINRNQSVTFQLMTHSKGDAGDWYPLGAEFPAHRIDDLIAELQKAKRLLDDQFEKTPEGYKTRHVFF